MGKKTFFRAKKLSVNTWRSGPDICSLICASGPVKCFSRQVVHTIYLSWEYSFRKYIYPSCKRKEFNSSDKRIHVVCGRKFLQDFGVSSPITTPTFKTPQYNGFGVKRQKDIQVTFS